MDDPACSPRCGGGMVCVSPQMQRVYQQIAKTSQGTYPVLIRGETGTGKELVARSIHFAGPRRTGSFVPVDCPAISPALLESELFGHVQGAFTGATHTSRGLMLAANGGTLFLDEIGDLPMMLQPKLLRALQEKEIRPVGSINTIPLNVRILAATNCNLETAVSEGAFRQDLLFRLNVLEVSVPPLREHRDDIQLLAMHFLEKFSGSHDGSWKISGGAMELLTAYDWPGNVRELEHAIESAVVFCSDSTIQANDLGARIVGHACARPPEDDFIWDLALQERRMIIMALERTQGDKIAAAGLLRIGKTTLYRKLKQYDSAAVTN